MMSIATVTVIVVAIAAAALCSSRRIDKKMFAKTRGLKMQEKTIAEAKATSELESYTLSDPVAITPEHCQSNFVKQEGYTLSGGDLGTDEMTVKDALKKAETIKGCIGFTFKGKDAGGHHHIVFWSDKVVSSPDSDSTFYMLQKSAPRSEDCKFHFVKQAGYTLAGGDLDTAEMTVKQAMEKAEAMAKDGCRFFTFKGVDAGGRHHIVFKSDKVVYSPDSDSTFYMLKEN